MQLFYVNLCGFSKLSFLEDVASWSDSEGIFRDLKEDLNSPLNLQLHLLVARKDTRGKHFSQPWIIFFGKPTIFSQYDWIDAIHQMCNKALLVDLHTLISFKYNQFPTASSEQEAHGSFWYSWLVSNAAACSGCLCGKKAKTWAIKQSASPLLPALQCITQKGRKSADSRGFSRFSLGAQLAEEKSGNFFFGRGCRGELLLILGLLI